MANRVSISSKKPRTSLILRGVLALILMVGFYCLAIAIAAGLLYVPYAEYTYEGRVHVRIAAFCIIGASMILWSIFPRGERFIAPGPKLDPLRHPRLFAEISGIAEATNQEMPKEVYLVPEVNAWVGQFGGFMGFGSRRVMGLGLPLLRVLKVSELRAVLAHEFGHYHGGDTSIGPLVYRTRAAIIRTLANLSSSILQKPFLWYGKLFLRITHGVSRSQEYAADRLAAEVVGARPLVSGLKTIHGAAPAFDAYWQGEVAPLLERGYRPPIAEGFHQFMKSGTVSKLVQQQISDDLNQSKSDPYDTHPALPQRIAALSDASGGKIPHDDPLSGELLDDIEQLELEMLACVGGPESAAKLQPVKWNDVGEKVHLENWVDTLRRHGPVLSGVTAGKISRAIKDPEPVLLRLEKQVGQSIPREHGQEVVSDLIGTALAVALHRQNIQMSCEVGEPIAFQIGESVIHPFNVAQMLADGQLTNDAWLEQCAQAGIMDVDLGELASHPVEASA